jgi:hypothetical protein
MSTVRFVISIAFLPVVLGAFYTAVEGEHYRRR